MPFANDIIRHIASLYYTLKLYLGMKFVLSCQQNRDTISIFSGSKTNTINLILRLSRSCALSHYNHDFLLCMLLTSMCVLMKMLHGILMLHTHTIFFVIKFWHGDIYMLFMLSYI